MHKERGQALIFGLILLPIILMFLLYLYNISQQNLNKTRLQNTADAAAISGSQFLVRELNFKAYTNRAMIANHVAIAQYVGLSSWSHFLEETTSNIADITAAIPYVGQVTNGVDQGVSAYNSIAQPALNVAVGFTDIVNFALSSSQEIMSYGLTIAMLDSLRTVVDINDSDARIDVLAAPDLIPTLINDWQDFQGKFDRKDRTGRYNDYFNAITNSRDPFSVNRSHNWGGIWKFRIPLVHKLATKQAGGTELINNGHNNKETWSAMDTLGLHFHLWKCSLFSGCKWRGGEIPTGWGASHAGYDKSTRSYSNSYYWGRSKSINRNSSRYAYQNEEDINDAYGGIYSFYAVKETKKTNDAPPLTILVSKDFSKIRTSSKLKIGTEDEDSTREVDINIEEGLEVARNQQTSIAKARVYYYRDPGLWNLPGNKFEYSNLYNPYWQNSLSDLTNDERSLYLSAGLGL